MRVASLALALILIAAPAVAEEHSHRDEIVTVATATAIALVASAQCDDFYVRVGAIEELNTLMHIMKDDVAAVQTETRDLGNAYLDQVAKSGAKAWCDDALGRFGPTGSMMRGLLKRQDLPD